MARGGTLAEATFAQIRLLSFQTDIWAVLTLSGSSFKDTFTPQKLVPEDWEQVWFPTLDQAELEQSSSCSNNNNNKKKKVCYSLGYYLYADVRFSPKTSQNLKVPFVFA